MLFQNIFSIWLLLNVSVLSLPLHKINLQDKKVFEIASDNKDYDEQSENEMIQPKELRNLNLYIEDQNRYRPLHSYVDSYNKHETINKIQHTNMYFHLESKIWENSNIGEDDAPFIAGFKENLDKVITTSLSLDNDENVALLIFTFRLQKTGIQNLQNNSSFSKITNVAANINKNKRSISANIFEEDPRYADSTEPGEEAYDYDQFKKEYEGQIEKYINSNKTLNFTDEGKLEEHPKEILQKLVDFKNCTNLTGTFHIKPLNCLMYNYEQQKDKRIVKRTLRKIGLTIKVWFLIYVCVAVPCWCHKGWCCWCFHFKFCFPKKRILFAKQYYANNPPGTFRQIQRKEEDEKGPIKYEPTEFEEDMYKKLEAAIKNI